MHHIDSSNAQPRITVFILVCGRVEISRRCYESLLEQSFGDFLPLVVDDGSVDNAKQTVGSWRTDGRMTIRHLHAEKPGRHHAVNKAIEVVDSELFMVLDAGDCLAPEALQTIITEWDAIADKEHYAGMQCLCRTESGEIIGTPFKRTDTNNFEMRLIDGVTGEKGFIYQTSKLKAHSLPDFEGEEVPDSILHNRVSRDSLFRCIPQALVVKPSRLSETAEEPPSRPVSFNARILQFNELNYFPMPHRLYLTINAQYVKVSLLAGRKLGRIVGEAIGKRPLFYGALLSGFFGAARMVARQRAAKRAAG
jgi:glycosyltransferase involved in cell wall biosynthesis